MFALTLRSYSLIAMAGMCAAANAQSLLGSFTWADNGHRYDVYGAPAGISYQDAETFAAAQGGYLATMTSTEENSAFTAALGSVVPSTAYLGAMQPLDEQDPTANWSWVTGEAWSYTNWNSGEPNDFFGVASEQYLEIYTDGLWNDIGDNSAGFNNGFVVESVPEPVSVATLAVVGAALLRRRMRV